MAKNKGILIVLALLAAVLGVFYQDIFGGISKIQPPEKTKEIAFMPFTLTDQNNRTVTERVLDGKAQLVFFGFTNCPDICPLAMQAMTSAMEALTPQEAAQVQPVFMTIDPDRDTPEVIANFLKPFYPTFLGFSPVKGKPYTAPQDFKVYFAKQQAQLEGKISKQEAEKAKPYAMNHSSYIYLMSKQGKFINVFAHDSEPEKLTAAIRAMLAEHK